MELSERAFDLAQKRVEEERLAGVAAVRFSMFAAGSEDCDDCGSVISRERRAAAPFARRCLDCQNAFETDMRRCA